MGMHVSIVPAPRVQTVGPAFERGLGNDRRTAWQEDRLRHAHSLLMMQ